MKCPLIIIREPPDPARDDSQIADCLQAECAWWVDYEGPDHRHHANCAIGHISDMLFRLGIILARGGKA